MRRERESKAPPERAKNSSIDGLIPQLRRSSRVAVRPLIGATVATPHMLPICSNHILAGLDALPAKRAAGARRETNRALTATKICIPTAVLLGLVISTLEW
jgi:hypothetical protein